MRIRNAILCKLVFSSVGVVLLSVIAFSQQLPQGGNREAAIRISYNKLSLYNGAANAQTAAEIGAAYDQTKDLMFEIRNVRTGPIREISESPIGRLVDKPSGDVINVGRIVRTFNRGPEHVMYRAKWVVSSYKGSLLEDWENTSVARMLQLTNNSDVVEYTSYEVTVRFEGRERTYKAMALHHDSFQTSVEPRIDFLDNVLGQSTLGNAFTERKPQVRAPWSEYVKSDAYRSYVEAQKKTTTRPDKSNDIERREPEAAAFQPEPTLPESCDFQVIYGPQKGKYRVDYQYHNSPVSWGQHDVRSALQGVCFYDQTCYVRCTVNETNLEINEYGFPSSACHQTGSSILAEDSTAPEDDGATCSATIGVGFKACLFCACSVSVTITPVTVSTDGFWTYQHKLTHSCPCLH
jgi:hypothetical protein